MIAAGSYRISSSCASSAARIDRRSDTRTEALFTRRLSIRLGCCIASRNPRDGSTSNVSEIVPNCRSRSSRAVLRFRSSARNHATLAATVLAPTPPRVPMITIRRLRSPAGTLAAASAPSARWIAFSTLRSVSGLAR